MRRDTCPFEVNEDRTEPGDQDAARLPVTSADPTHRRLSGWPSLLPPTGSSVVGPAGPSPWCAAWALGSRELGELGSESAVEPVTDSNLCLHGPAQRPADLYWNDPFDAVCWKRAERAVRRRWPEHGGTADGARTWFCTRDAVGPGPPGRSCNLSGMLTADGRQHGDPWIRGVIDGEAYVSRARRHGTHAGRCCGSASRPRGGGWGQARRLSRCGRAIAGRRRGSVRWFRGVPVSGETAGLWPRGCLPARGSAGTGSAEAAGAGG